jgi:WD40 repeat protein
MRLRHTPQVDGSVQLAADPAPPQVPDQRFRSVDLEAGSSPAPITRPVLHALRGHEGSIHRCFRSNSCFLLPPPPCKALPSFVWCHMMLWSVVASRDSILIRCRVAWSADGAVLASGSDDRTIRLWAAGPAANAGANMSVLFSSSEHVIHHRARCHAVSR